MNIYIERTDLSGVRKYQIQRCQGQSPRTLKGLSPTDMTKYCRFHSCVGHEKYNSYRLKDVIKELIKNGKLKCFTKEGKARLP